MVWSVVGGTAERSAAGRRRSMNRTGGLVHRLSYPMTPSSPSSSSNSSSTGLEQLSKTNLYIRGLPPATTDLDLVKLCHQYYPSPYPVTNRIMTVQPAMSPYMSPVSAYQAAVMSPSVDPSMSLHPSAMITQQMGQLSLGNGGAYISGNPGVQGAYMPQYPPLQAAPARLPLCEPEGRWEIADDIAVITVTTFSDWTRHMNFFAQPRCLWWKMRTV
ncbi:RNA-binding motif, single-stranded-interacting protein 1 [Collichthys lucidus]|uniref:RNA-binding motif, single-stranded-interacting protein 1 n=1 Tax=Collichthys lucidus TaxID=240159 RepID=A0A4U5U700_COLLU|nr:RNA-binding motif, single-stranded-interacting protein 1 [Collichthys lucidus]